MLAAGRRSSRAIGRNPANKPLVDACRPVEVRDGVVILGFPENQAFLREKAEQQASSLEDGIGAGPRPPGRGALRGNQRRAGR